MTGLPNSRMVVYTEVIPLRRIVVNLLIPLMPHGKTLLASAAGREASLDEF